MTKDALTKLGAPVGSELSFERDGQACTEPLGESEVLEVYLDGINLPVEVYDELNFDVLCNRLQEALANNSAGFQTQATEPGAP